MMLSCICGSAQLVLAQAGQGESGHSSDAVVVLCALQTGQGVGICHCCGPNCPCNTAPCGGPTPSKCNDNAWAQYKQHLRPALALYAGAFSASDRSLKDFQEAGEDIERELGVGATLGGDMMSVPEISFLDEELQTLYASLATTVKNVGAPVTTVKGIAGPSVTLLVGFVAEAGELYIAISELNEALSNLDAATRSEERMFQRGDAEWDAALAALQQALTASSCPQDQAGLKAQQSLDERAKKYLDDLPLNGNGTYHIGDQNYDGEAALAKVKTILQAGQQSKTQPASRIYLASYMPQNGTQQTGVALTLAQAQEVLAQLKLASQQFHAEGTVIKARLAVLQQTLKELRAVQSQMGNR